MSGHAPNPRPRLKLADASRAKLARLLSIDVSSERAERAVREVEERLSIFAAVQRQQSAQKLSKRGAPASDPLMELIRLLRLVFRRHYRCRRAGRGLRGAVTSLSAEEKQELRFVHVALCADGLQYRGRQSLLGHDEPQYLATIFRDPRCTPPMMDGRRPGTAEPVLERAQAIEDMAKKARQLRQPSIVLANKITQQKLCDKFTARDVMRKGWPYLKSGPEVNAAIECLVREGWLLAVERPASAKGGRPTTEYQAMPRH